ncbi:2-hydroxychromene-2-carboxylate isomerase [Bradyrhizobium jicamae]|uniref:2-hydroxychromene-2-carboxylate isomerase n=1 Tax=Bradyrhizobium jicamae TaxID=280332 RepID=A0ABS5FDY3_9BRAD|nr:2-hydroxychromene-2-carboxylate isomerase [Bradyrhizobium jicamae]MBR0795019.1 2-hydroxychromene-2-carboxylate isomerase [Bradyrhizobium jicamae]
MPAPSIDFFFTMGSTYSYLTVMRLPEVERASGLVFRWRPFHLLTILNEMKHVPFADKPAKMNYMWRDVGRRAAMHGIPVKLPAPYPAKQSVFANQVALLGMREGWGQAFIREAYRQWFQLGLETGSEPNVSASLHAIGQDPAPIMERARSDDVGQALSNETDRARALGIFGSPNFVVDGELFWGDDRLEDAVSWAKLRRVK